MFLFPSFANDIRITFIPAQCGCKLCKFSPTVDGKKDARIHEILSYHLLQTTQTIQLIVCATQIMANIFLNISHVLLTPNEMLHGYKT